MNLQPANDLLLIIVDGSEKTTDGGIVLTGCAVGDKTGVVLAAGPGKWHEQSGCRLPVGASAGDRVVYAPQDARPLIIDGTHCTHEDGRHMVWVRASDLLAVVVGSED